MSIILCTCSFHYRILDFEPNQCRQFHLDGHNQRPVQHTAGSSSQVHTWDSLDIHLCLCVNVATSHCDRPDQTSVPPYSSGMSGNKGTEQGQLACLAQTLHQVLGQSTVRKVMVLQKVYLNNVFPFWTKCDEESKMWIETSNEIIVVGGIYLIKEALQLASCPSPQCGRLKGES